MNYWVIDKRNNQAIAKCHTQREAISRAETLNAQWIFCGFPPHDYAIYYNPIGMLCATVCGNVTGPDVITYR
jgi:hypothetical protein